MKALSTPEVAEAIGVHTITLERWLATGKIDGPKRLHVGGRVVRLWTDDDVKRLRKYKADHYRKGRGRKKGKKLKG
jgi:predicted site-specific integrase-resolvase